MDRAEFLDLIKDRDVTDFKVEFTFTIKKSAD